MPYSESRWIGGQTALGGNLPREGAYKAAHDAAHRTSPGAGRPSGPSAGDARQTDVRQADVHEPDRADFLEAVLGPDEDAAAQFVDGLRARGVDAATVYLDLLGPTAVTLGELWTDDACDFVDVTLAISRMQRVLHHLGSAFVHAGPEGGAAGGGRVLLCSLPGDQHTLGMYIVAEFLLRDGWSVRVSNPGTSAELAALLRDEWFDVVGFSAACDVRLLTLRHEIAGVRRHSRNPHVSVLVGGRVFVEHPDLADRVGADAFAASAADAPRRARALLCPRLA